MMKKTNVKHDNNNISRWITVIMLMIVALCFCSAKSGYFIDEIYSYGLSNSEYAPFILNVMEGDITGKIINHKDLLDYVVAGENRFNYASVYYNQTQDVHPPLYYCILHTICSIFPDCFSKWLGLIPNLLFFALTICLLLWLSDELFERTAGISLSVIILYGLSVAGMSTVLFIRMYMLMTLLTVLLACVVLKLIRHGRTFLYPVVSAVILMGLMTHYYFVFYAFFICLFYVVYLWKKKQYKGMLIFMLFAFMGVGSMYMIFPDCIVHMTKRTGTGQTTLQQLLALNEYIPRFYALFTQISKNLFLAAICGGGVCVYCYSTTRK